LRFLWVCRLSCSLSGLSFLLTTSLS
jgi:hypothetical protein